jgi:hypothetical protein
VVDAVPEGDVGAGLAGHVEEFRGIGDLGVVVGGRQVERDEVAAVASS